MERPPELLKSFANRLAETAVSERGAELARLIRLAGFLTTPTSSCADDPAHETRGESANPNRVGIWERRTEDGKSYFVRRKEMANQWHFWANLGRIEPKGAKRRVVLLGESVARGFLYDPLFTPAQVLETILQSQLGHGEVEVVDLARTDLGLETLAELAASVPTLEPDAVVILAGNNWHPCPKSPDEIRNVVTILRESGVRGLKAYAETKLISSVQRLVKSVASAYESLSIPVVWVIPEYNLADWRDPETNAPHLAGAANQEWISLWRDARGALSRGDVNSALELATRMTDLDGGVSATGLRILAECNQRLGNKDAARRFMELTRDALVWDPSITLSPRPYAAVQETLRAEAAKHNHEAVSLPEIFKEHLNGDLPDRRVFIDYCHLTAEGMRVAMSATASCLVRCFKGVDVHWTRMADQRIAPTQEVEAGASLLGAIHNAHWGQDYDLVQYYCNRAIESSPKIAQVMVRLIDLQTRQAPMWMCRSAEQIAGLTSQAIQHYLFRFNGQLLDRLLLDSMVGSLKKMGINAREQLDKLRREEHGVGHKEVDLLDPYYYRTSPQQRELGWKLLVNPSIPVNNDYYKGYGPESHFYFVGEARQSVRLRLTCRLPDLAAAGGHIFVEVNGKRVGEIQVGHKWQAVEHEISGDAVRNGVNELTIRWPLPAFDGKKALMAASDDLLQGVVPDFFPVFGEIHSFTASGEQAAA